MFLKCEKRLKNKICFSIYRELLKFPLKKFTIFLFETHFMIFKVLDMNWYRHISYICENVC